jgi:hypothetical protein
MTGVVESRKRALAGEGEGEPVAQRAVAAFRQWAEVAERSDEQLAEVEALAARYRLVELKGATSQYAWRDGTCRFEIDPPKRESKRRAADQAPPLVAHFRWNTNDDEESAEFELELEQCGTVSMDGNNAKSVMSAVAKRLGLQSSLPAAALLRLLLAFASCDKYGPPWHTAHWDVIAAGNKMRPWPLRD